MEACLAPEHVGAALTSGIAYKVFDFLSPEGHVNGKCVSVPIRKLSSPGSQLVMPAFAIEAHDDVSQYQTVIWSMQQNKLRISSTSIVG
jgi:hypothetical protein